MARRGEIQDGKTLCALGAMRSAKG
jgi:hypothetical protein